VQPEYAERVYDYWVRNQVTPQRRRHDRCRHRSGAGHSRTDG
jgi:hypothetical protein